VWSFTTACGVPGHFRFISAEWFGRNINEPSLTWSSSGASAYDVHFGTGSNPSVVTTTTSASYSPYADDNRSITGRSWREQLRGSTTGDVWSFTTAVWRPDSGRPDAVNGATGASTSLCELDGANASSYDVYFGTSPNPSSYVTTTAGTTYSTSGLNNNTTYYWKIVARNACGDLTPGPVWSFTTSAPPAHRSPSLDPMEGNPSHRFTLHRPVERSCSGNKIQRGLFDQQRVHVENDCKQRHRLQLYLAGAITEKEQKLSGQSDRP